MPCLTKGSGLPRWLSDRQNYTSWQRANLWLIHETLALNDEHFTLRDYGMAQRLRGSGTYHMLTVAKEYGASVVTIDTVELV